MGKLGLVSDVDIEMNGYFYSLDAVNGYMQIRSWGYNPDDNKSNFTYIKLQDTIFPVNPERTYSFSLLRYGSYIELSIDGIVKLTLIDFQYSGKNLGFYSSSSAISIKNSTIHVLPDPKSEYMVEEA